MIDFDLFKKVLFGNKPDFPNLVSDRYEEIPHDGLTMGTLFLGRQGSGKTSALARHIVDYFTAYPNRPIFVLDWSGSITDSILHLILAQERKVNVKEKLIDRIVYDDMGNPEWVIPMPEFYLDYGNPEEQVQRVAKNIARLAPELVKNTPFLGGLAIQEIGPEIFRVISSITNELNETWQLTEAKKLIRDEGLLRRALTIFGYKVPHAKWWLEKVYLDIKPQERELRTYALVSLLGTIEPPEIRARLGYYRPAWTPREAIEKGQLVLCDGARLINREGAQHFLFMQVYSLIMQEINRRRPADPNDQPVSIVMDEVYSLIQIPGMAPEISKLSPQYRSRKLQLYIVLQELAQMSDELRPHIWSLGNVACFGMSNLNEAYEIAQQLFKYDPRTVKVPAVTPNHNPIIEPDRGQYLLIANWIQSLKHRECITRRYMSEREQDRYIRYVRKTKDNPKAGVEESLDSLKERLLRERGVRLRDALDVINKRTITMDQVRSTKRPPSI